MENKSKNRGCLKALLISFIVFAAISIIVSLFDDPGSNEGVKISPETTNVVDSAMIKYQDSLQVERKKKIDTEREKFNVKYDDIDGITWIYSKTKPYYDNIIAFYNYIGLKDDGQAWKRLLIRYHGDDWLFINEIIIKTDNNTYTIDASDSKRDHNADVWEWIDITESSVEEAIIHDIINSNKTKVRFIGSQYHHDWILPKNAIKGLQEIEDYHYKLNAYYSLLNR